MEQSIYNFKIAICGNQGVGKTNFYCKLVNNNNFQEDISLKSHRISKNLNNGSKIEAKICFYEENNISCENLILCDGYFLLYDVTNHESFVCLKEWLTSIQGKVKNQTIIMIVGNKKDIENERQVLLEEATEFSNGEKVLFIEASAKLGINVDESFINMLTEIVKKMSQNAQQNNSYDSETAYISKLEEDVAELIKREYEKEDLPFFHRAILYKIAEKHSHDIRYGRVKTMHEGIRERSANFKDYTEICFVTKTVDKESNRKQNIFESIINKYGNRIIAARQRGFDSFGLSLIVMHSKQERNVIIVMIIAPVFDKRDEKIKDLFIKIKKDQAPVTQLSKYGEYINSYLKIIDFNLLEEIEHFEITPSNNIYQNSNNLEYYDQNAGMLFLYLVQSGNFLDIIHDTYNQFFVDIQATGKSKYVINFFFIRNNEVFKYSVKVDTSKGDKKPVQLEPIEQKNAEVKISSDSENEQKKSFVKVLDTQTINNLEKIKELGQGGNGIVYEVITKDESKKTYALKILNQNSFQNMKSLLNEYELLHILDHPNILKTYGIFLSDETTPASILLEFCVTDLNQAIKSKSLSNVDLVFSIYQIAEGMKYVHFRHIIHRDLKPSNIMIDSNGTIKISDFGISKLMTTEEQTSMTGGIGTLYYTAPEIINDEDYNEKVDVFSFGVLLFFVLSGGKIPKGFLKNVLSQTKTEIEPSFSLFSKQMIDSCWNFEYQNRPSFNEICDVLERNKYNILELSLPEQEQLKNKIENHKKLIPLY